MMEVAVTTEAIRHAKLRQIVTTIKQHPTFYRPDARCLSSKPTNSVRALKGNHMISVLSYITHNFLYTH